MVGIFFGDPQDIIRIIVISTLAYACLVIALQLAGKRALAKLNAFDLVVTIALGSTFATVLLTKDIVLVEGLVAFGMLMLLQWCVARVSVSSTIFRRLVRSDPRLLVESCKYRQVAMREERVTAGEVDAAVRSAGIANIEDVAAVVLETDGSFSVIKGQGKALKVIEGVMR